MTELPPIVWGGCGVCHGGVTSENGFLVWDAAGKIGTFACQRHLPQVKARNPKGSVETL